MKRLGCAPGYFADRGSPILRVGSSKREQSLDDLAAMHVEDATGSAGYVAPQQIGEHFGVGPVGSTREHSIQILPVGGTHVHRPRLERELVGYRYEHQRA